MHLIIIIVLIILIIVATYYWFVIRKKCKLNSDCKVNQTCNSGMCAGVVSPSLSSVVTPPSSSVINPLPSPVVTPSSPQVINPPSISPVITPSPVVMTPTAESKSCYQWIKFTPSEISLLPENNIGYDSDDTTDSNLNLNYPVAAKDADGKWYFGLTTADVDSKEWGILEYVDSDGIAKDLDDTIPYDLYYIKSTNNSPISFPKNVSPTNYMYTPDGKEQVCISDPTTNVANTIGSFLSRYNPVTKYCTSWTAQAGSVYPVQNTCIN